MNHNDYRADRYAPDPIRTAPVDLYGRLHDVGDRMNEIRRELAEIRREYRTLRRHPDALEVDTLGAPMDPVEATDAVLSDLDHVDERVRVAEHEVAETRGRYASRLKLTDHAAEELDQRNRQRAPIERTR
ncbi:hypothetical protein [Nocardia aobensis]|uniref:hypothetical protein n=1 Tax=Nocardia aobensis TaxID=257277 RepID=UPI0002EAC939|nr:hypothetical protein [Nocardia aobensis]